MAPAKKTSPARRIQWIPPAASVALRWAWGPGRTASLLTLILAVFFGGWYFAWQLVKGDVLGGRLQRENIEIPPLPSWIRDASFRNQVFDVAVQQGPLSIHDDDLLERLRSAFALHPWVARVESVRRVYPAAVRVELVYRKPVCMVQVDEAWIPVDAEGYVLPGDDFSPLEAQRYPRLVGVESRPLVQAGTRWNDPRVSGGAEIAAALADVWAKMNLARIVPSRLPELGYGQAHTFKLYTAKGNCIDWWHAPTSSPPSEPTAADKVAKLEKYLEEHGTLDGPFPLDVTRPNSIELQIGPKSGS